MTKPLKKTLRPPDRCATLPGSKEPQLKTAPAPRQPATIRVQAPQPGRRRLTLAATPTKTMPAGTNTAIQTQLQQSTSSHSITTIHHVTHLITHHSDMLPVFLACLSRQNGRQPGLSYMRDSLSAPQIGAARLPHALKSLGLVGCTQNTPCQAQHSWKLCAIAGT